MFEAIYRPDPIQIQKIRYIPDPNQVQSNPHLWY